MLPATVRHAVLPRVQRLLLELEGPDLVLRNGSVGAVREVERIVLDATDDITVASRPEDVSEVVLCLPKDKALTRALTLPLAAEENLREVLAFEMNRQTPFRADQVYYDYMVVVGTPGRRLWVSNWCWRRAAFWTGCLRNSARWAFIRTW